MERRRLVLGLAAVFAGLTAVLAIAAVVVQPFLLVLAVPFGATTYFLWMHATGRLAGRARRQQASEHGNATGSRRSRVAAAVADRVGVDPDQVGDRDRTTGRAAAGERTAGRSTATGATGTRADATSRARQRRRQQSRRQRNDRRREGRRRANQRGGARTSDELSRAEACRILGVSPEADQETIREAYRERVKRVHPDAESGDKASFKRLNRAYERLKQE